MFSVIISGLTLNLWISFCTLPLPYPVSTRYVLALTVFPAVISDSLSPIKNSLFLSIGRSFIAVISIPAFGFLQSQSTLYLSSLELVSCGQKYNPSIFAPCTASS